MRVGANTVLPVELIGYIGRAIAYDKTGELIPYILQSLLLLLAPILFAASLYMTLSRVIISVDGARCSIIPPRWLTRIFITGDVVSFMIQGGGAGILVKADSKSSQQTGENIIIAGLVFQILIFAVFGVAGIIFHVRFKNQDLGESFHDRPWQSTLVMLYGTSLLIMVRNIFRVVEYAMGHDGYLLSNEWTVYVFDGVPMFLAMALFAYKYPSGLRKAKTIDAGVELLDSDSNANRKHGF